MRACYRVLTAPGEEFNWEQVGERLEIGRDAACGLSFTGAAASGVSSRHAAVVLGPQGATIADLGSLNGTFLNGRRVARPEPLAVGDEIGLGQAGPRLRVVALELLPTPASPPAPRPVPLATSPPPAAASDHPSPTRKLLVELQTQQRSQQRTMLLATAGLAATAVVVLAAVLLYGLPDRDVPQAANDRNGPDAGNPPIPTAATATSTSSGKTTAPATGMASGSGTATPTAAPTADPPPVGDPLRALEPYVGAVVILGVEEQQHRHPICTGWAVDRRTIVTTASNLALIESQQASASAAGETQRVFAWTAAQPKEAQYVVELRKHPRYLLEADGTPTEGAIHGNVGIARLEKDLAVTPCPLATEAEVLASFRDNTPIATAWMVLTEAMIGRTLDLGNPPQLERRAASIVRGDFASAAVTVPRRLLSLSADDNGLSGAPVFNARGRVVAIVRVTGDKVYGIPAHQVAELLEPSR